MIKHLLAMSELNFEIKRKLFHLLALLYILGINLLPRPLFLGAMGILFVLDALLEFLRLRYPPFAERFLSFVGFLFRGSEEKKISGVFWMILGVMGTALLLESNRLATTALLYLIAGDAMASLVGQSVRGPKWPRLDKSYSGSAACFLTCLLIGTLILGSSFDWRGIAATALAATIFELGFFNINDNMLIPVGTAITMLIAFGLKPAFF